MTSIDSNDGALTTGQNPVEPVDRFGFLIVGAGRGGTSLLAALLDAHPDLEVGFERHAIDHLMGRTLAGPRRDDLRHRIEVFVSACNADALRSDRPIWGNKITTEQIQGLEDHNRADPGGREDVLRVFFTDYLQHLKLVFILRDGRACVQSKVRRAGRSYELACARWRYSVQCYRFLRQERPDALLLRFEDLLQAPSAALGRICDYLGVPFREEMLGGVRSDKLRPEYRNERIDSAKAVAVDFPPEYLPLIGDDLAYCGYSV
jgi:hypothetical protein